MINDQLPMTKQLSMNNEQTAEGDRNDRVRQDRSSRDGPTG